LLHQAGYVSYPHHDADGVATYIRIESGAKMWVFFRLKSDKGGRAAYANAMMNLVDYANHKEEVHKLWDAEVVFLSPGNIVYARFMSVITSLAAKRHTEYSPLVRCMGLTHPWKALQPDPPSTTSHQCTIQKGLGTWTTKKPNFSQIKRTPTHIRSRR
jgi:predicted RNA-binding protein YlxR (DUF448 family)